MRLETEIEKMFWLWNVGNEVDASSDIFKMLIELLFILHHRNVNTAQR